MLPNFKSKILTQLSDLQKDNCPLLFSLLGQCFQDVGLTEWTSIVAKQCPDNADCTKANFDECIRDYLEAVAGFPNIGNQLIRWLCIVALTKRPAYACKNLQLFQVNRIRILSSLIKYDDVLVMDVWDPRHLSFVA